MSRDKVFLGMNDDLFIVKGNGIDFVEGEEAFPEEIEMQVWRRERLPEFDGKRLVAKQRYRRVDE